MSDAAPASGSPASPAPGGASPAPVGGAPAGGAAPAPAAAPTRPEWLPEAHWDAASGIKPEFGAHYTEIANAHKTFTEQQAALAARKPEDIKIEVKLPDTVKVPDGMNLKIDEKDPRVAALRTMALKNGWTQDHVNELVAFDAQQQIAGHTAEQARIGDEMKKLGANADDRLKAVSTWAKGITTDPAELGEIKILTATAAGVSLLERLMQKSNGSVPGAQNNPPPPKTEPKSHADRIWPGGFQKKVS